MARPGPTRLPFARAFPLPTAFRTPEPSAEPIRCASDFRLTVVPALAALPRGGLRPFPFPALATGPSA